MEGLDYVYDGSTKETGPGYWTIHIHAIDAQGKHYPVLIEPYSVRETGFRSALTEHQRDWNSVHQAFGGHGGGFSMQDLITPSTSDGQLKTSLHF